MKHDYFSYNDGKGIVPDGAFRISASQISRYFDETANWYREFLLGEKGFTGNTATVLGNCVHAAAEMYTDDGAVDRKQIENYILSQATKEDVDTAVVREQYAPMIETLINDFVKDNKPTSTEEFVWQEILPGIGVGGSIDALVERSGHTTIRDYKTMGSLQSNRMPTSFKRAYWFQLMTYAWVLQQQGKRVTQLELVYVTRNETGRTSEKTGKPLKDYPSTVGVVRHQITPEDFIIIESCIKVIAESVHLWNTQPELRHVLSQDYRNKGKPKPALFKD